MTRMRRFIKPSLNAFKQQNLEDLSRKPHNLALTPCLRVALSMDDVPLPEAATVDQCAKELSNKKNVVFLTDHNLSGKTISSLQNPETLWTTQKKTEIKLEELLTSGGFYNNPEEVWRWHHELKKQILASEPGPSHLAIAEFQKHCHDVNKNFTLLTQSIDGFHNLAQTNLNRKHKFLTKKQEKVVWK